jgi:hypothetical protein
MNVSLDLFELIKSLSKSEKRYFRLSASLQKGDKAYLKIFDLIEKQEAYDEKELKLKFKKEKFIKHLPFTKRYLYNSIIKSLLAYNNEKSAEHKLVEQLLKAKLLYNRSLFSQAQAARSKAITLARKHEKDYLYFELVRTEIQTLKRSRYGIDIKHNIFKEEKFINEKIQALYKYSKLYVDLADIRLTHGFIRAEQYHDVMEDIARQLPEINENSTVKEKYLHLSTFVRIASLKGDMNSMLSLAKDILAFVESNPDSFKDDNILELIQAYLDIFHPSIKSGRFDEYEYYLKRFRRIKPKSPVDEINMFLVICLSEISKFLAKADFKEGINFIKYAESGLEKYRGKLHPDDESVILYNISRIYMGSAEYEKALEYSNRLLGRQAAEMRPDIYCYAKVLNLVIHYELNNDELVRYLIRSVYKLFKKREKLYRFESLLLGFLRKLPGMLTKEDFMDNLILFRKEMLVLQGDPYEKNAFIYFDFISWAESKIHNKSFEQIVKEKVFA